jgi:hypothetical protein
VYAQYIPAVAIPSAACTKMMDLHLGYDQNRTLYNEYADVPDRAQQNAAAQMIVLQSAIRRAVAIATFCESETLIES